MVDLSQIRSPDDVKKLDKKELPELCRALRETMIGTVAQNGGHLSSNLGAVELTVALHRVFTTPHDTIVWDVGHQCYAHKLLTGRYDRFSTLRKKGGISGFPKPSESEHDAFVTGHSSTSISAANGIAKAKALTGDDGYTVAVIGDGALTGGLAYEGLSNAGRSDDRLIVILNDNKMSISQNVGFVARYLTHLRTRVRYVRWKQRLTNILSHIPLIGKPINTFAHDMKKRVKRSLFAHTSFFENMGFYYMGPVDGHDLSDLTQALLAARSIGRPVLLHVATVKGKGYPQAEKSPDTYHGIGGFSPETGEPAPGGESFSSRFGELMCRLGEQDDRIVAITAAMKKGTCLDGFSWRFPTRFFDVGIAEEHAVTFASGLSCGGLIPVFAVYSTFLQRSFDQLLNDTSIMDRHIVLAIDRAGIVPDDGETHQGLYDVAMLRDIPHTTVYAPANFRELEIHLRQAMYDTGGIAAVRYPKGGEHPLLAGYEPSYKSFDYQNGRTDELLLIGYGRTFGDVLAVSRQRQQNGRRTSLLKLDRIWPLDPEVEELCMGYRTVLFFEEAARNGGIGEYLGSRLLSRGFAGRYAVDAVDILPGACTTAEGLHEAGLDADGIARFIERQLTDRKDEDTDAE